MSKEPRTLLQRDEAMSEAIEAMTGRIEEGRPAVGSVPDMRVRGQLTRLETRTKNKKRSRNSYMYVCSVLCAPYVKHV